MKTIAAWQKEVHALARAKGWWDGKLTLEGYLTLPNIPEKLALIHSEISEALEVCRDSDRSLDEIWMSKKEKPEGFSIELADAVIRIMDLCHALGIDLEAAIDLKHAYNTTRPFRHGGKRA